MGGSASVAILLLTQGCRCRLCLPLQCVSWVKFLHDLCKVWILCCLQKSLLLIGSMCCAWKCKCNYCVALLKMSFQISVFCAERESGKECCMVCARHRDCIAYKSSFCCLVQHVAHGRAGTAIVFLAWSFCCRLCAPVQGWVFNTKLLLQIAFSTQVSARKHS